MNVKQLINELKKHDDNKEIIVAWHRDGISEIEGIDSINLNGNSVQLLLDSLMENIIKGIK